MPLRRTLHLMCAIFRQPKRASHVQHVNWTAVPFHTTRTDKPFSLQIDGEEAICEFKDVVKKAQQIVDGAGSRLSSIVDIA